MWWRKTAVSSLEYCNDTHHVYGLNESRSPVLMILSQKYIFLRKRKKMVPTLAIMMYFWKQ